MEHVALKMMKLKNARKLQTYVFRRVRVKARVKILHKYPKQSFLVVAIFMVIFTSKIISIKSIFTKNLSLINLQSAVFGLKSLNEMQVIFLYWFSAQQQMSIFTHHEFWFFLLKFECRMENLFSQLRKIPAGYIKINDTKECSKTIDILVSRCNSQSTREKSGKIPKIKFFCDSFIYGYLQLSNDVH